jgi:hypothetical protein
MIRIRSRRGNSLRQKRGGGR